MKGFVYSEAVDSYSEAADQLVRIEPVSNVVTGDQIEKVRSVYSVAAGDQIEKVRSVYSVLYSRRWPY